MAIEFGLLFLAAICGSILGLGILLACALLWYYLSLAKLKKVIEPYMTVKEPLLGGKGQVIESSIAPERTIDARHYEIPDPSRSFDLGPRDIVLPQHHENLSIPLAQTESPSRSVHTNESGSMHDHDPVVVHDVIKEFEQKKKDDLHLHLGDQVTISMTFTDGMGHGINVSTGMSGMFPLACISLKSAVPETAPSGNSPDFEMPPLAPEGEGKLLFSMVNPDDALEIINASMSPERRKLYFDSLLKNNNSNDTPNASNTSVNNAGTRDSEGSRASRNWSRLRMGWKDAVKAELKSSFDSWEAHRNRQSFWRMMAENYTLNN